MLVMMAILLIASLFVTGGGRRSPAAFQNGQRYNGKRRSFWEMDPTACLVWEGTMSFPGWEGTTAYWEVTAGMSCTGSRR
jgi:hypothetical protein